MEKYMTFDDCMNIIVMLSNSQGYYGRMLQDISKLNKEVLQSLKNCWESKKFKTDAEFIMYIER